MGHWAGRQRSGGGAGPLNFIKRVEVDTDTTLLATYEKNVDSAMFEPADFDTLPNELLATAVVNQGANELLISFSDDIPAELSLRYDGNAPNTLTPQTLSIS
jgi:hypothetical protein